MNSKDELARQAFARGETRATKEIVAEMRRGDSIAAKLNRGLRESRKWAANLTRVFMRKRENQ